MFFYAVFALAMLAGRKRYWVLGALLIGLVAVGLAYHAAGTPGTAIAFYSDPIVLEFIFGVTVYYLVPKINAPRPIVLAFLVAGFAVLLLNSGTIHRVIADGIPAVVIVWAAVKLGGSVNEVRWLRFVGDASYSIYLFHLAALSLIVKALHSGAPVAALPLPIAFVVIMALPVVVGIAIHLLLERPLLRMLLRNHSITHESPRSSTSELFRAPRVG
jgi:exopolysaccharide production protein ExoZ